MSKKTHTLLSLLSNRNWFIFNKDLSFFCGTKEAIFLGQLINKFGLHYENDELLDDEWFYESRESIMIDTGLSIDFQVDATSRLKKMGVISVRRVGMPARNYYKINEDKLKEAIEEGGKKRLEAQEKYRNSIKENTIRKIKENDEKSKEEPQIWENTQSEENIVNTTDLGNNQILSYENTKSGSGDDQNQDLSNQGTINKEFLKKKREKEDQEKNSNSLSHLKNSFGKEKEENSTTPPPPLQDKEEKEKVEQSKVDQMIDIFSEMTGKKVIKLPKVVSQFRNIEEYFEIDDFKKVISSYISVLDFVYSNGLEDLVYDPYLQLNYEIFIKNIDKFINGEEEILKGIASSGKTNELLKKYRGKKFNGIKTVVEKQISEEDLENQFYTERNRLLDDVLNKLSDSEKDSIEQEFIEYVLKNIFLSKKLQSDGRNSVTIKNFYNIFIAKKFLGEERHKFENWKKSKGL